MLNFSQLLSPQFRRSPNNAVSDQLRFQNEGTFPPVIVWNLTYRCNLSCIHCYAGSESKPFTGELTTEQCLNIVDQLADAGVTYIVFSGGDPLIRPDFFTIAAAASKKGLPISLSTNGTLISRDSAKKLKDVGILYAGISLDGIGAVNDKIRGLKGAYEKALQGARFCKEENIKVGLRMTLVKGNIDQVNSLIDLAEQENFDRVYFSHLVYSGRAEEMQKDALSHDATRMLVTKLIDRAESLIAAKKKIEVVTGSNDTDGVFLFLNKREENEARAMEIYEKLKKRGGNTSGVKIANIDNTGDLHVDQFWRKHSLGNVMTTPFSKLWTREDHRILSGLRDRKKHLKGRCGKCGYLELCMGNTRSRAEHLTGDPWAPDPACYLTDKEIGL